jgi:hypothetical protein
VSVAVIVSAFTATHMVGPDHKFGRVDAFPGPPTGGLLTPQPPRTSEVPAGPDQQDHDGRGEHSAAPPRVGPDGVPVTQFASPGRADQDGVAPQPGGNGTGGGYGDGGTGSGGGGGDRETGDPTSSATTPPPTDAPAGDAVVAATEQFFSFLPHDIESAWAMISSRAVIQNYVQFRDYWSQYQQVTLQHVAVGADSLTVVATIQVTPHKQQPVTQRWKLNYRFDQRLVIDEVTLLAGSVDPGANEPFH